MSNNICNDTAYQNMVLQKQRFQLLNIPPVRYDNLANNPYEKIYPNTTRKFTKLDLDMRRKVEVLKYNASSTQTNRFTKAQIYAQAISGKYQQRTYPNSYITDNTINNQLITCPTINTPTSACGVPGPVIYLYEDNNVPLYKYLTNIDSNYGTLTQGANPYEKTWDYTTNETNKKVTLSTGTTITSIFILYKEVDTKTFTVSIPIGLEFNGQTTTNATLSTTNITIQNTFTSSNDFPTAAYYNATSVQNQITYVYDPTTINITVNKENSINFSGRCYLGMLTIYNIRLPIQKGFIYDIKAEPINKTFFNTNLYINTFTSNILFGYSANTISAKCTISGNVIPPIPLPTIFVYAIDN